MAVSFSDYLEAKYFLDMRCLNKDVRDSLVCLLRDKGPVRWLDIGTGTGSMIKHLLRSQVQNPFEITGLDINAELLRRARDGLHGFFQDQNYRLREQQEMLIAESDHRSISMHFEPGPLQDISANLSPGYYDLITAHAVMDIVPLRSSVELIANRLGEGGIFYATINYDGETSFFPTYTNQAFEGQLLASYNVSMERRRANGEKTGGAKTGRRLYQTLSDREFEIVAYGSSDWNLTPIRGTYRDDDQTCLLALLDMIYDEGTRQDLDQSELKEWHENRSRLTQCQKLGMIVHQIDVLARKKL